MPGAGTAGPRSGRVRDGLGRTRQCRADPVRGGCRRHAVVYSGIDGDQLPAAAFVIVAFAVVLGTLVGIARWAYAALAGRVDILTQALDASPDPQLILTPDGRIAYADTAYRELFPAAHERPMPAIAAALADFDAMPDFERLRSRAAQGPAPLLRCRCVIRAAPP